jgi:hypothetical protein
MERALPVLRKHYLLYAEYAGLEMKDAFYGFAEQVQPLEAARMGSAICYGDGKGGFTITDLPAALQLAPIFAFQKARSTSTENRYISGGNFFDVIPYEGRYDAQAAALFGISKQGVVADIPQQEFNTIKGQLRDIKWLRTIGKDSLLAIAPNNSPLFFYKPQQ